MTSLGAKATVLLLRLVNRRKAYSSVGGLMQGIAQTRKAGPARPTSAIASALQSFQGRDVYRVRPRRAEPRSSRVLYLHGGGYVRPITRYHWRMIAELAEATGLEFIVPLYPLAPESHGLVALRFVTDLYRSLVGGDGHLFVMGDSAGAGLALSLAASLRDSGDELPKRLVLLTPFVDVELLHADAARIAPVDPMLGIDGIREAGRLYAGDMPTSHPSISPSRGDPTGLPPMTLFVGTRDILGPDALDYAQSARACGCVVDLRVEEDMIHAWAVMGFAEAKRTRAEMASVLMSSIDP